MAIAVVWLKRDLRVSDHRPLADAIESGLPVLIVYCFEPILITDPHYSPRHWQFVAESLQDIASRIPSGSILFSEDSAEETFHSIHNKLDIKALYSHQEVGLNNTFERDKAVAQWCKRNNIQWHETPYGAVIRALQHRKNWDKHWQKVMRSKTTEPALAEAIWVNLPSHHNQEILQRYLNTEGEFQTGGETAALTELTSFFSERGQSYAYSLSSPLLSRKHCSRLSAYLAWGNLSLRQVYQAVLQQWKKPGWRRSLSALSSRLHWHCHFIQKFESESEMEYRAINRGYEQLPRCHGEIAKQRLIAWQNGTTGIPMVDACMRCLATTGYINFRMRAMLVSFLCHHLELDWRLGTEHLARLFLDFEPGIHYSQFQMQAGVTGINTIRIYNPVKQGQEKDPDGTFVKQWLPELNEIPVPLVHSPWLLSPMEQIMYQVQLGVEYPAPIVDLKHSYKTAQQLLWQWRNKPTVKAEAQRILRIHVRPNNE